MLFLRRRLLQWKPELDGGRYTPRLWEKWIHAAYFGRVYYWIQGLQIVSYTFEPSLKSVPKKTWYAENGRTSGDVLNAQIWAFS